MFDGGYRNFKIPITRITDSGSNTWIIVVIVIIIICCICCSCSSSIGGLIYYTNTDTTTTEGFRTVKPNKSKKHKRVKPNSHRTSEIVNVY